ncbi:MAG: sodium:solute symporter family protein [Fidelibacterota bacterium]|nr:MAG: sodium:solute symporter family protein [Candidatus Neomarinimicrobiota bacterium]
MTATWIAFTLYAITAIALGWRSHRQRTSSTDFWTAGRHLNSSSVGLSISAGFMSVSWSCVYAVQLFYWYGLGALWLITIPWLISLTGIYFLARRYHCLPAFSQPEMVGRRFGPSARRIVALALAFVFLVWGGAEIYVAAILLSPQMGISASNMILIISLVVGIYATLGGFRAVVATDKLQFIIVALYILAMGWMTAKGLSLTNQGLPSVGATGTKSNLGWTTLFSPGIVIIMVTFAAYLPGWLFETDLWVRVQAARNDRAARKGVALAGMNAFLFVGLLPLFIGVSSLILFPLEGGIYPEAVGSEGDSIFAALVTNYSPGWLAVLVAVGLVAAAMSTIDTCANVMALSVAYDLFKVHDQPHGQRWSQVTMAGAVIAACIFALNTESLWDIFYLSSGVLTTAVAFPVAAVFLPWANQRGTVWSSAAGLGGIILAYFLEVHGPLAAWEPAWLADTDLGFILWGLLAAAAGYGLGMVTQRN